MADPQERRKAMVERQIARRGIDSPAVLDAFRQVPREAFVPEEMREFAYEDGPLPIGQGQTISQPYIVALMIEAAGVSPGDRVLEVGAGSGYAAAKAPSSFWGSSIAGSGSAASAMHSGSVFSRAGR